MAIEGTYTDDSGQVFLMPSLFNDTLQLLLLAHEYFQKHGQAEQQHFVGRERMLYSSEMSRITIRLSSIMAWLMVQRAIFSGKITAEHAMESFRLDSQDICLHENEEARHTLPKFMTHLLDESLDLYRRVKRLDDQNFTTSYHA